MKLICSSVDIACISSSVLGEARQAMDCGVYLVQCVRCPTVPTSGVLVGVNLSDICVITVHYPTLYAVGIRSV